MTYKKLATLSLLSRNVFVGSLRTWELEVILELRAP
jgi:hypothetical protein